MEKPVKNITHCAVFIFFLLSNFKPNWRKEGKTEGIKTWFHSFTPSRVIWLFIKFSPHLSMQRMVSKFVGHRSLAIDCASLEPGPSFIWLTFPPEVKGSTPQ